jgi:hypothetical protein
VSFRGSTTFIFMSTMRILLWVFPFQGKILPEILSK